MGDFCHWKEIFTVQGEYSANMIREAVLKVDLGLEKTGSCARKTADPLSGMSAQECILCIK